MNMIVSISTHTAKRIFKIYSWDGFWCSSSVGCADIRLLTFRKDQPRLDAISDHDDIFPRARVI